MIFQSTLPMRGATISCKKLREVLLISIHTPHAGSDFTAVKDAVQINISIHTPHAGSDPEKTHVPADSEISIHTPHAGSDSIWSLTGMCPANFNPHSPCGERPRYPASAAVRLGFQSTLPMRGAT